MDRSWEHAILRGDADLVRDMLARGADPDARDRHGQTGLMLAAMRGHAAVIDALVGRGADLNVTAKYGLSALMLAVVNQHVQIARTLARAGADLTLRGSGAPGFAGKTARDLAAARGMDDLLDELRPR